MPMIRGHNQEYIFRRQSALKKIFVEFDKRHERPTNRKLLDRLKNEGYNISYDTLLDDKKEIFKTSKFVENLASNSYSRTIEECYNDIVSVSLKARQIYDKLSLSKKVIEEHTNKDGKTTRRVTKTTASPELAQSKLYALRMIRECAMAISKLISGESFQVSAGMWARHMDKMEQEMIKLRAENEKFKSHQTGTAL